VLLIGESGVGKSTWINAFANYCSFESLEDAVKAGGFYPIPCTFSVFDPRTKKVIVITSWGEGEPGLSVPVAKPGESVTQNPNEYAFRHKQTVINFIDTPGLLDTRDAGTSKHFNDKKHVDNIFKLLSSYQEIHAIFILMKANEYRLSDSLQYTLTEIFKRLNKEACDNVVFVLTNAASVQFQPDTLPPILQQFLENNKLPIALPPNKPTIYCFENYTVKYIAECKNKIPHNEYTERDAPISWQKSVKSTQELLHYVSSLEPLPLDAIKSITDAFNTVSMMSRLLLDTMMCIYKDVNELEEKKIEAEKLKKEIEQNPREFASEKLNSLLHITETKLVHNTLGYTNVVCESIKCSKVVGVNEGRDKRLVSTQVCCTACSGFLLYFCSSIGWQGKCRRCGCAMRMHRWTTTETQVVKKSVYRPKDEVVDEIVDSNEALRQLKEGISQFENQVKTYEKEAQKMIEICAKLNAFMQQHASLVTSSKDKLLECLENQRQTYGRSTDGSRQVGDLAKIRNQYEQELIKAKSCSLGVKDVPQLIEQLCKLPIKGDEIQQAVNEDKRARRQVVHQGLESKRNWIIKGASAVEIFLPEYSTEQTEQNSQTMDT